MTSTNAKQTSKNEPELADAEYDKKWDQESILVPNRKANDPRFGEIHIFKKKNSNDIVFSKEKMSSSKQQAGKDIKELKSRVALNRPNVQKLLGYSTSTRKELCSTSYFTQGFYEFPKSDLHKESTQKIQNGQSFTESELSGIANQALNGLHNLHSQNITHGDIRPQYIGMSKESNEAIILDRLADPSTMEKVQASHIIGGKNQLYLSPEMYKKIQGKDNSSKYDPFKNDVYALALSIVEAGNGKSLKDIYNTNGTVDQTKLDAHLNAFSQKYKGEYLNNLVRTSLSKDQSSRLTTGELNGKLGSWKETGVFAHAEPLSQTTITKTENSTVQSSEPSLFGNFSSQVNAGPETVTTTTVVNTPAVVHNVQSTPSFLKPTTAQETYYVDSNTQQNNWQQPHQSHHVVHHETPRQEQSTTLNSSQSYNWANPQTYSQVQTHVMNQPTDYATPFEYSNSLSPNQGYQSYSQQHVQVTEAPMKTQYVSSQQNVRTYSQAPVATETVRKYSQAPQSIEYITTQPQYTTVYSEAPVRTEYITSQPQYTTTYSQAPVVTTEYVSQPQYTTVHTQAPVRTEYITSHAPTQVYTQVPYQTDSSHHNVVTTMTHQPSVITSNQVQYLSPVLGSEVKKSVVFSNAITPISNLVSNSQRNVSNSNVEHWVTGGNQYFVSQSERVLSSNNNVWNQSNSKVVEGRKSVTFINQEEPAHRLGTSNVIRTEVVKSSWDQSHENSGHQNVISYDEFLRLKKDDPTISLKETTSYATQFSQSPVVVSQHVSNHEQYLHQQPTQVVTYTTQQYDHHDQNNNQAPVQTHHEYQEQQTQRVVTQNVYESHPQAHHEELNQATDQYDKNQYSNQYTGSQWSNGNRVVQNFSSDVQSSDYQTDPSSIKVRRYRIENGNKVEISPSSF